MSEKVIKIRKCILENIISTNCNMIDQSKRRRVTYLVADHLKELKLTHIHGPTFGNEK